MSLDWALGTNKCASSNSHQQFSKHSWSAAADLMHPAESRSFKVGFDAYWTNAILTGRKKQPPSFPLLHGKITEPWQSTTKSFLQPLGRSITLCSAVICCLYPQRKHFPTLRWKWSPSSAEQQTTAAHTEERERTEREEYALGLPTVRYEPQEAVWEWAHTQCSQSRWHICRSIKGISAAYPANPFNDGIFHKKRVQNISWAKFSECPKEQPNPHGAGRQTCFGSGYDTGRHPPGGSVSSCSSPHPAATPLCTSAAPLQKRPQESHHIQVPSSPLPLPLLRTAATTRTLWVTPPLSPKPKKASEWHPALSNLRQAGWSRTRGGNPRGSPGTGAAVTGCQRKPEQRFIYCGINVVTNELTMVEGPWHLLSSFL